VGVYQSFRYTCCLHHQGDHGPATQKIVTFKLKRRFHTDSVLLFRIIQKGATVRVQYLSNNSYESIFQDCSHFNSFHDLQW
jgi:hypothetical protein